MLNFDLFKDGEFKRVSAAVAAGMATTNCDAVDMAGYDSVAFVALIGTIAASGTVDMKAQQDSASGMGSAADLAGTKVSLTDADDDKMLILNIHRPRERYVRAVITTAVGNGTIDGVFAILYNARNKPITQGSTVGAGESHQSPAEGTA